MEEFFTPKVQFACIGIVQALFFGYVYKKCIQNSLKVAVSIDISGLSKIDDRELINNLFRLSTQRMPDYLQKLSSSQKLTFYSLYKQVHEGDADELPGYEDQLNTPKFKAWMQQKGKSMDQCKMEYIVYLGAFDQQIRNITASVVAGEIKYIKVEAGIDETSGGALAKTVSKPKQEDLSQYLATLSTDEKNIFDIFNQIRLEKNEQLLLQKLRQGTLQLGKDKNKEGMDPLIFAVDCEFSIEALEQMARLQGFNPNVQDDHGRTPLHYAFDLDNEELAKFLLEKGADPKIQDIQGKIPTDDIEDIPENIQALIERKSKD